MEKECTKEEQKEKTRIIRIARRKKQRGEDALDEKWMVFFDAWCDEVWKKEKKRIAEEKEKSLDSFVYRRKTYYFYNPDKIKDL